MSQNKQTSLYPQITEYLGMGEKLKGVQSFDFLLKASFSLKAFNRKETNVLF